MVRIVTRKSPLAMIQTKQVIDQLKSLNPEMDFQIIPIDSEGDQTNHPFRNKVSFVKNLDQSLDSGFADIAVHSLKDMSVRPTPKLSSPIVLARDEHRDVLVSQYYPNLKSMPNGALIGTSSPRRSAQIKLQHPRLQVVTCRGNIQTRLNKLEQGDFQGLILAGAALERLGIHDAIGEYLPVDVMTPCPGQGTIAVQCRMDDESIKPMIAKLMHTPTHLCVDIERGLARRFEIDCSTPVGIFCQPGTDAQLTLYFFLSFADGDQAIQETFSLDMTTGHDLSHQLDEIYTVLCAKGADDIVNYYKQLP